jgi:hypothetical protein
MTLNLDALIINIVASSIIVAPSVWLSGRAFVGKEKAKLSDAIWIVVLGTTVGAILGAYFSGFTASSVQLILWLLIVKHFFDCGWLKALAISFIAVIFFAGTAIILGIFGFALLSFV